MKVHFPCITQGKGALLLVKALETDYSRLRYQLGISTESGSNSGAERALSLSTTTIKHPQEVPPSHALLPWSHLKTWMWKVLAGHALAGLYSHSCRGVWLPLGH